MKLTAKTRPILVAVAGAVLVSVAASQAHRIFESSYRPWTAMLVPFVSLAVGVLVRRFPVPARIVAQAIAILAISGVVLSRAGGSVPGDLFKASVQGISSILGSRWPVPELPIPVTAIVVLVSTAAAVAVELALSARFSAAVLLPPLALTALFALLGAESGPPSPRILVVLALGCLGVLRLAALLRTDLPDHARGAPQVAERKSMWTLAILGVTATTVGVVPALLAGSLPDDDRYDPRDRQQGSSLPLDVVSPLSRLDEWRGRQPAEVVFSTTDTNEGRWRLVALTRFDGRTWMPPDDYRTVGRQLQEQVDLTTDPRQATVTLGELDSNWLPTPGRVLSISMPVLLDGGNGGLLLQTPPSSGATYDITYEPDVVDYEAISAISATRHQKILLGDAEIPPGIATLAAQITQGATTDLRRAERIAEYLVENYRFDPEAPAGHSIGLITLFLNDVKRGRDEQFVAAFALLADAVGLPVRISVGFTTQRVATGGARALSSDAIAWPEVEFERVGWVPFDPIPEPQGTEGGQGTEVVSPAPVDEGRAPQTSAASTPSTSAAEQPRTPFGSATGVIGSPIGRLVLLALLLLLIAVLYVVIVLRVKSGRRNRREQATESDLQVTGAFKTSIDTLVDLGARAPSYKTDRELVLSGRAVIGGEAPELLPLAEVSTRAVFDRDVPSSEQATEAWEQVRLFEEQTRNRVGRWRWLKSRISLRSLRRGLPD